MGGEAHHAIKTKAKGKATEVCHKWVDIKLTTPSVSQRSDLAFLIKNTTLHRVPVGQGPRSPRLAMALGFWSWQALATRTARLGGDMFNRLPAL